MASKEPSLWDDGENDPAAWDYVSDSTPAEESAKQRSSGKKHKSWWEDDDAMQPKGRGHARSKSKIIGFNYHDTLDDSDDYWYRKNSFQYSRAYDYSPSRQFRSFYSTSSYGGYSSFGSDASSELANKCLNALRTLTRSANTIVEKKENANYLVQIKTDAESVRVAQATDEHKKMLYVSSADLAAAKTTDDEDRVVDELTGFVLLRVQLMEGNQPNVLDEINATGFHGVPGTIATALYSNRAGIEPKTLATDVVSKYLAGLISKAMLARIARKDVIKNWGGFGPYFARHAAKFAAAEEKLKSQPANNTENVVGRIVYNLLNDETPLPLGDTPEDAKNIEDIMAAHFEAEVPAEKMLETSCNVVKKIHEYFKAKNPEASVGETGAAIEEAIEKLTQQMDGEKLAREQLEKSLLSLGEEFSKNCAADAMASTDTALKTNTSAADDAMNAADELKAINDATNVVAASSSPGHMSMPSYRFDPSTKCIIRDVAKINLPIPMRNSDSEEARKKFKAKTEPLLDALIKARQEKFDEYQALAKKAAEEYRKHAEEMEEKLVARLKQLRQQVLAHSKAANQHELDSKLAEKTAEEKAMLEQRAELEKTAINICKDWQETLKHIRGGIAHDVADVNGISTVASARDIVSAARELPSDLLRNELALIKNYVQRLSKLAEAMTRFSAGRDNINKLGDAARIYHSYVQNEVNATGKELPSKALERLASQAVKASHRSEHFKFEQLYEFIRQMTEIDISDHDKINAAEDALNKMNLPRSTVENLAHYPGAKNSGQIKEVVEKIKAALQKANEKSAVDNSLFEPEELAALKFEKSGGLEEATAALINKEANNAQEEEFVAFLDRTSLDSARPRIELLKPTPRDYRVGAPITTALLTKNKSSIQNIQNALVFQAGRRSVEEYGMISGELDEGSLHKLGYESEHVWSRKTMMRLPDVAVGLLIDQSGSMCGRKIDAAREMCIVLAAALQRIKGVRLYIYGHTANSSGRGDLSLFEHYRPDHGNKLTNLGTIEAIANNYDGYALKEAARYVSQDPAKRKYMFVIADGFPAGAGYGGANARKHVTSVVKFLKERWHMHTYAFGVGIDNEKDFCAQYGKEHTVFVNNVRACQGKIVRFLRNVLQREKTLVDVAD